MFKRGTKLVDFPNFGVSKISMLRIFRFFGAPNILLSSPLFRYFEIRHLKKLEKYLGPLSTSDPVAMRELLPNLINSIRMIHTISRYYNTSERMTSLFVKVTNQMIKSCRNYIMQGSSGKIWDQNEDDVLARIDACIALNDEYQGKY